MQSTKRILVAGLLATGLFIGSASLLGAPAFAAPRKPVEAGATTPGLFQQTRCNRYANEINGLMDRADRTGSPDYVDQAKQKQDEALDNGCFIVNPV